MKNMPGPLAPPGNERPSRNITALSYSCTTFKIHSFFVFWICELKLYGLTFKHIVNEKGTVKNINA